MKLSRLSLVVLVALGSAVLTSAQDATGKIFGTVYDQQSAVIPGVRVTVTDTATQVERSITTDHEGSFQVLALPIGTYRVKAEKEGFRTVLSAEQKLSINQALRIDVRMEIGAMNQRSEERRV